MSIADDKVRTFESSVLLPSLEEVSGAKRLLEKYNCAVIVKRPFADAGVEELLTALAAALRRRAGPSLAIIDRAPPAGISPLGGRYVMTVFYDVRGDDVLASPSASATAAFPDRALRVTCKRSPSPADRGG